MLSVLLHSCKACRLGALSADPRQQYDGLFNSLKQTFSITIKIKAYA